MLDNLQLNNTILKNLKKSEQNFTIKWERTKKSQNKMGSHEFWDKTKTVWNDKKERNSRRIHFREKNQNANLTMKKIKGRKKAWIAFSDTNWSMYKEKGILQKRQTIFQSKWKNTSRSKRTKSVGTQYQVIDVWCSRKKSKIIRDENEDIKLISYQPKNKMNSTPKSEIK